MIVLLEPLLTPSVCVSSVPLGVMQALSLPRAACHVRGVLILVRLLQLRQQVPWFALLAVLEHLQIRKDLHHVQLALYQLTPMHLQYLVLIARRISTVC